MIKTIKGRTVHTNDSFKATFKVGDIIIGFPTNKRSTITAIGNIRFLMTDSSGRESAGSMTNANGWAKVVPINESINL